MVGKFKVRPIGIQGSYTVTTLVHLHFNLVSSVLIPFQIGQHKWCEMMIELEASFWNRASTGNDKSARGSKPAQE